MGKCIIKSKKTDVFDLNWLLCCVCRDLKRRLMGCRRSSMLFRTRAQS